MLPPAPGRFTTTTGWPQAALSDAATSRAALSDAPPAGVGTTMVMARLG